MNNEPILRYDLSSTTNPLGPPPSALHAMRHRLATVNAYQYADDASLRGSIAHALLYSVSADQVITGNGSSELLDLVCRAFLDPGDECILPTPTIPIYQEPVSRTGAAIVFVPLEPRNFQWDTDALIAAITGNTRLIFLPSPNNPTGSILTRDAMDRLLRAIPPRAILVCDQAYYHFVTDNNYAAALDYIRKGLPVICLHSFSHAYGLAGLRLAYAFSTPAITDQLRGYTRPFPINTLSMDAGIAALADHAFLRRSIHSTIRERKWLYNTLAGMGLRFWPGQGNFLLLQAPYSTTLFAAHLLARGIKIRVGEGFAIPGCIRLTVGTRPANKAFIQALQQLLR